MNVKINLLKLIIQIKYRSSCFESKIIQWSFIGHWSGYIVSNCEHACILTQDGWGRPILTELMIFDQNLNFNRVTIIIIRIFYKLIWWFPQIFSQCHETFLILKVTDLRCLLKETDCVRILASHSYGVVVSRPASLCLAATNVTMVDILIQLFSFLRCLKSVIFKIRWDSSYWINITKRPIIWKLFFSMWGWEKLLNTETNSKSIDDF